MPAMVIFGGHVFAGGGANAQHALRIYGVTILLLKYFVTLVDVN